jgi:SAM-dependent methyltransferase
MSEFGRVDDYWEWAHSTRNMSSLTGSLLDDHLGFLKLGPLTPGMAVLCIGVGDGNWIREAARRTGRQVYALDISPTALAGVFGSAIGYTPETFRRRQFEEEFDLALSLWVSPHMKSAQVASQIAAIVPTLKKTGTFGIHYNEPLPGTTFSEDKHIAGYPNEVEALRAGLFRMTRSHFDGIVEAAGGIIAERADVIAAPEYNEMLCRAHIKRAK